MGAKNSKFDRNASATTLNGHDDPSNSSIYQKTCNSQHSLVKKFKRSLSPSPSERSFSERIDPSSDSSVSSFQKKTRKLLLKRKNDKSRQNSISVESGERVSLLSTTNTVEYLDTLDPMTAAAERLSARFDETHAVDRKRAFSFSAMQRQMELLDYNQDIERNQNVPQPTSFLITTAAGTASRSSSYSSTQGALPKDVCQTINEEWLNTKCSSSSVAPSRQHQKITSQEIVLDLFMGHSNDSDRRKEKDRQQRMV